jgi:hypothetical protein
MRRKQIYIHEDQDFLVKEACAQYGISEAEIIRKGIDMYFSNKNIRLPKNQKAWQKELAFIKKLKKKYKDMPETGRTWRREDLYDR